VLLDVLRPTIGAYLPSLARDERELGPANSAWSTLDNLAFIVGPGLAFVLVAAFDVTWAFLINAVSFAVCAAILWGIPPDRRSRTEEPTAAAGAAPAGREDPLPTADGEADTAPGSPPSARRLMRPIGGLVAIDIAAAFVFGGIGILTVILAEDVFAAGTEATGLLNAAIGIGGLIGALASGALVVRRRLAGPFLGGAVALGVGVGLLGIVGGIEIALVAMVVLAAGDLVLEVVSTTVFQRIVPDEIRGRTLGLRETLGMVAYAAGSFALPILAVQLGVAPVLLAAGGAVVVCGLLAMALLGTATTAMPAPLPFDVRRIAGLPVFAGVPAARLDDILGRLVPVPIVTGQIVIREGEAPDRFYVIEHGSFDVSQADESGGHRHLRTMGPDEVFGEIGLLTGRPRTATVTAATDGLLLALDAGDFAELVSIGPGLGNRLLDLHRGAAATWIEDATPVSSG
jgi:MFS family permease